MGNKEWQDWIHPGPQHLCGVLRCPQYGTFHKVSQADAMRVIGVTLCTTLVWIALVIIGLCDNGFHDLFTNMDKGHPKGHSALAMLFHTDAPNHFTNTLTAPVLIWYTWRAEPKPEESDGRCERRENGLVYLPRSTEEEEVINELAREIYARGRSQIEITQRAT